MRRSSVSRDDKSKTRRRSRTSSTSSSGRESSRRSSSSGEREGARKRHSDPVPEATAGAPLPSALPTGTTSATGSVADPRGIEAPKSKRRLSFYGDAQHSAPDATASQRQRDGSAEHRKCEVADDPSTEARSSLKTAATDGRPASAHAAAEEGDELPPGERNASQKKQTAKPAAARISGSHTSSMASKKETADAPMTPEVSSELLPPDMIKTRTRRGSLVTLSVPKASLSRGGSSVKESTQDSGSQREPSFKSFIQGLKSLSTERHEEQQKRSRASKSWILDSYHDHRLSRIVVTVAGIPVKMKHVLLMAILILMVASVIAAIILFTREEESAPTKPYCKTRGCLVHAWRLSNKLNSSLDPCRDFGAYVCSAWSPPEGYLEHSNSAMDDVRKSWFPGFEQVLKKAPRNFASATRPSACMLRVWEKVNSMARTSTFSGSSSMNVDCPGQTSRSLVTLALSRY
ncbi:hypothetical protein HPB52_000927 [Rhipicephalus sanguineus]|uniref:Uncharacterized protein n=1 Tax=Rhipicephalus sanguineus TaxID=34632 RepID=A0A9D4SVD2_RHISA|nr:hypothetical protein HPB52_000927 [Rhipicephalus sanguineus]